MRLTEKEMTSIRDLHFISSASVQDTQMIAWHIIEFFCEPVIAS